MPRGHDAPERPENTNEKPDQSPPAHENESEGPSMSRRDMLKKSAYAAPAIMTIGSVPRFAEGAPSSCSDKGQGDENSSSKSQGEGCGVTGDGTSNGNGREDGNGSGVGHGLNQRGKGHGNTNYGSSNQGDNNYGSGSYTGNDYGDEYGSND
ncbi:hypothetical protein [Salinibacter ruber]|nr:hypothetical protein [Salinibacter ruber]MCS3612941.1 hypothetical protein [Salinibacter ruber]MCS3675213.1 hypothetical protein [Salinibacter ruber]MCS3785041.1 hypothetical protein [Salinibacter ruber]